jgi:Uma2 family endonuclease
MKKMGLPEKKTDRRYTYGDYRTWPDEERWELINGTAWNMSPAPSRKHQKILLRLTLCIGNFLQYGPCEVYPAPFDVLLPDFLDQSEEDITTVVQPDLAVICDEYKLSESGCRGAPDWIIEILSPSTSWKDLKKKRDLYEKHGVREYWIMDPGNKYVHIFRLDEEGIYPEEPELFVRENTVPTIFSKLSIDLKELFKDF